MRLTHPEKAKGKKIVCVIGAGFAGLNAAKALCCEKDLHVILIDQKNHHLFQPLLYQVATAGLNPADIAVPIRAQFRDYKNVEVHWGAINEVDLKEKIFRNSPEKDELEFDYLVLACGSQHSYFGHPEWEEFAPGLKTLEQATEMRRRILAAFEMAENEMNPEAQKSWLTFVVVGGGPTGVEMAGAIADISRTVLVDDFKHINPASARVVLVEAGDRLLSSFDEKLSARTKSDLEKLGVEVRLKTRVENIDAQGVSLGDQKISSRTVFWGAGVQASPMKVVPEVERDRAGRIKVNPDLSIPGHSDIFVIGDMAQIPWKDKFVPGLAPAAIQAGKHVAGVIRATLKNEKRKAFEYFDKGQMATIGKHKAVVQQGQLRMTGFLAWTAWLFVHVYYLVTFKNRISVMRQWVWSYVFSKRGARLITDRDWRLRK